MAVLNGYEGPDFGIPNADTTSPGYDPATQFVDRYQRLRELSDEDVVFVGEGVQKLVGDLATFAASALRAGITTAEEGGHDSDAVLTSSGIDVIHFAIMAAVTNVTTRTVMDGTARGVQLVDRSVSSTLPGGADSTGEKDA